MVVDVAVSAGAGEALFTYAVPVTLRHRIAVGKRVLAPFGSRRVTGYIIEIKDDSKRDSLKDIIEILDRTPLFDPVDLKFYRWASEYYMYPLAKTLRLILPAGIDVESSRTCMVTQKPLTTDLTEHQQQILAVLAAFPKGVSVKSLKKKLPCRSLDKDLRKLTDTGFITILDTLKQPSVRKKKETRIRVAEGVTTLESFTERQRTLIEAIRTRGGMTLSQFRTEFSNAAGVLARLKKKGVIVTEERTFYRTPEAPPTIGDPQGTYTLTSEQSTALSAITDALAAHRFAPFLLHGVTGSGKTEIYLGAISRALALGGSILLLVPEIALTPQLVGRVRDRFGDDRLAVLHSGIRPGERYDQWRKIASGKAGIILGARSAIFAPARDLRLIIIDEEHDTSYKQDERMPYNARDLAVVRARFLSGVVVLGSATPEIQSYFNTKHKGFTYLHLSKRVANRTLPKVEIIDLKAPEGKQHMAGVLSQPLATAIQETLAAGKQTLLFLNRRGFTTFLSCVNCGYVFRCHNCSVTMTHHISDQTLKCHYCNYSIKAPPLCPNCHGHGIRSYGTGTEKLFHEIESRFPRARIARLDSDVASKRGAYSRILAALGARKIDILIGTQMIAKGHDFPHVTLVGVISADTSLNMPDFRASERTFQLLTQVSGRGGRGDTAGRVIIQTLNPLHYAILRAKDHDYLSFYDDELQARIALGYPPFSRMINLRISSKNEAKAAETAQRAAKFAHAAVQRRKSKIRAVSIIGPAQSPLTKIKGSYRWQLILKGTDTGILHDLTAEIMKAMGREASNIKIDVDPVNFM